MERDVGSGLGYMPFRPYLYSSRKSTIPKSCAPLQLQLADQRMQRVAMDILGPLPETDHGNKYILVIGDYFTKWKESITVARIFVNEFICRFGVPEQLHTDQGRNFESRKEL